MSCCTSARITFSPPYLPTTYGHIHLGYAGNQKSFVHSISFTGQQLPRMHHFEKQLPAQQQRGCETSAYDKRNPKLSNTPRHCPFPFACKKRHIRSSLEM